MRLVSQSDGDDKKPDKLPALGKILDDFLGQIDAILDTVNRIMPILLRSKARASEEFRVFLEPARASDGELDLSVFLPLFRNNRAEFLRLSKSADRSKISTSIVPTSFFVTTISQFDAFLARSLRELYSLRPEKLIALNRTVDIKTLTSFPTTAEVVTQLIDEEIDEVLRKGHLLQLKEIGKTFDFNVDAKDKLIGDFVEITERRNLFVHTDGIVNRQYLTSCNSAGAHLDDGVDIGSKLGAGRKYFNHVESVLYQIAFRFTQIAWRKVRPEHADWQYESVEEIANRLLEEKRYSLARSLLDFASQLKPLNEGQSRTICINRALAYKLGGRADEVEKILGEFDWRFCSMNFRLATAELRDQEKNVIELMKLAPEDDGRHGFRRDSFRHWPIFEGARKRESFQQAFRERFGEELVRPSVPEASLVDKVKQGLRNEPAAGSDSIAE